MHKHPQMERPRLPRTKQPLRSRPEQRDDQVAGTILKGAVSRAPFPNRVAGAPNLLVLMVRGGGAPAGFI